MSDVCQALQSNLFYSVDSTQALSTSFCVHTEGKVKRKVCYTRKKTPSITFQHLPPNSARFSYATEGALDLYLRAAVHRRGQRPPKGLGTDKTVEET